MKHLRLFKTEAEHTLFKESEDYILPNVSYTVDINTVFYNPGSSEPESSYIAVDLGLPSGRLWSDRNVGASSAEDYGLYFTWGDTVGYTSDQVTNGEKTFSSDFSDYFDTTDDGYTFNKYAVKKLKTLETSDDAARANMGSDWRMPTQAEFQELINNTTPTFIDLQGNEFSKSEALSAIPEYNLKGVKFTSKNNSNSIFIPASGYCLDSEFCYADWNCYLWSSDLDSSGSTGAMYLYSDCSGYLDVMSTDRYCGIAVRGVK